MLKLLKKEKGFTLIELMVVVLIIAILVAIAVPVFNIARSSAQKRSCQANLRTLDGAIQTYHSTEDAWPPGTTYATLTGVLIPDYIKTAPTCPGNGTYDYVAESEDTTSTPHVHCSLAASAEHEYP